VFLTVWGFKSDGTLKNPQNTGGNALEPVVGIEPTTYGLRNRYFQRRKAVVEALKKAVFIGQIRGLLSRKTIPLTGTKRKEKAPLLLGFVRKSPVPTRGRGSATSARTEGQTNS
ncbi:MAG: hypothetical protein ACKPGI_03770, partial [Verrucomicrobiota bacterium]